MLPEVLDPLGQRLRTPTERRIQPRASIQLRQGRGRPWSGRVGQREGRAPDWLDPSVVDRLRAMRGPGESSPPLFCRFDREVARLHHRAMTGKPKQLLTAFGLAGGLVLALLGRDGAPNLLRRLRGTARSGR